MDPPAERELVMKGKGYASWFSGAMWLGIIVNCALAIPGIFQPNATLVLAGQRPALETPVWPAFASLLLMLLSFFYIPAAIDPYRYRVIAWLSMLARVHGVFFFLWLWPGLYPAFGYLDLTMLCIQLPLLLLALRDELSAQTGGDHDPVADREPA